MKPIRPPPSGFTLIEVMIAIGIMSVLSIIAWRGLDGMSRADAQLQQRTGETARRMRALQQFETDLRWRTTTELPAPPQTASRLLPAGMEAQASGQAPMQVEWVRAAPAEPGRWQRVRWWLQAGTLYRAVGPATDRYPIAAPQPADRVAVLADVAVFELRAWEPGRGWRRLPAPAVAGTAASGVEMVLGVRRGEGEVLRYRQVVALD